jgi:hypothetical protein
VKRRSRRLVFVRRSRRQVLPDGHRARVITGGPFGALPHFVVAAILSLLIVVGAAHGAGSLIYASFNSDGSMRLNLGDGSAVGAIPAGAYTVIVNNNTVNQDFGDTHKAHLFGPGVDYSSVLTQEEETQAVWSVTFQPNSTYTFQDDYRPTLIHVVFRTTATGTESSSSASVSTPSSSNTKSSKVTTNSDLAGSAVVPFRGTLAATIDAAGRLRLTKKGKPVGTLKAGLYTFTVLDNSAKRGFVIQKLKSGAIDLTSVGYKGTHVKTVNLKAGQWTFFSPSGKKNYFIVVA